VVGHAGLFVTPHQSYVADGYGEDDVTPTGRFVRIRHPHLESIILQLLACLLVVAGWLSACAVLALARVLGVLQFKLHQSLRVRAF
jgi:hypothetical protein